MIILHQTLALSHGDCVADVLAVSQIFNSLLPLGGQFKSSHLMKNVPNKFTLTAQEQPLKCF